MHAFVHFLNSGIGLRQVCDWTRLLATRHEDIDKLLLEKYFRKVRLLRAAKSFRDISPHYLGLPEDNLPFSVKSMERAGEILLDDIFATGNFGQHDARIKPRPKGYWAGKWHTFCRATKRCMKLRKFAPNEALWYPVTLIKGTVTIQINKLAARLTYMKTEQIKVHLGSISRTTGTYSPLLPHRYHWGSGFSCFYLCFQGRHRHCHRCRHRKPDQCRYPYYRFVNRPTSVRSRRHLAQCPYASGNWKRTAPPPILPSITKPLERIGTLPHRRYRKPVEQDTRRYRGGTDQYNSGFHSYHRSVGSRIRILLLSRSVLPLG